MAKLIGILASFTIFITILSCGYKGWCARLEITQELSKEKAVFRLRLVDYLKSVFCYRSEEAKRTRELIRQIEESLDIVQMRKELNEVKEENALMRKELARHNIVIPTTIEEPQGELVEGERLEGKEEEQMGSKKI